MKCTNPNCLYEWEPKVKNPKSCPRCRQYLRGCDSCGTTLVKPPRMTPQEFRDKRFCNSKCYGDFQRGTVKPHNQGEKNGQWKGEDVGYHALHDYVKTHMTKVLNCERCGLPKKLDIANISGEYKRDLRDWEWLCRKCHMKQDGRTGRQYIKPSKKSPQS